MEEWERHAAVAWLWNNNDINSIPLYIFFIVLIMLPEQNNINNSFTTENSNIWHQEYYWHQSINNNSLYNVNIMLLIIYKFFF